MHRYRILGKKGEGAFSEVLKAQDIETERFVAIKCMKKLFISKTQVNRLREIQAFRRLQPHPNIVQLIEILFDNSTGRLALVFEYIDMNLYEFIKWRRHLLNEEYIISLMYQLIKGLDHAHRMGIFHRDVKPENLLVSNDGVLKISDFGSCRGIYSAQPLTEYVATRWYRAPECLLTDGYYTYKMDLWSAGCVFFEIMTFFPLFPGNSELDQIQKIHTVLGTPPSELLDKLKKCGLHMDFDFSQKKGVGFKKLLRNASNDALDLLTQLLTYDDKQRVTAREALGHPYFKHIRENEEKHKHVHIERSEGTEKRKKKKKGIIFPRLGNTSAPLSLTQTMFEGNLKIGVEDATGIQSPVSLTSLPKI